MLGRVTVASLLLGACGFSFLVVFFAWVFDWQKKLQKLRRSSL